MKSSTACRALLFLLLLPACSPLRTSEHDERHQVELKIQRFETSLDDMRREFSNFQTELQILDGRIKYYENALSKIKEQDVETQKEKLESLEKILGRFEKKWGYLEEGHTRDKQELAQLIAHANETSLSLGQFKKRIEAMETQLHRHDRKLEFQKPVTGDRPLENYHVRAGDSLEKIAKLYDTDVISLKKINHLTNDLIVVGQELKVPTLAFEP
jgi:LysM repeat protein